MTDAKMNRGGYLRGGRWGVTASVILAVYDPIKRLEKLSIVDTISTQ